MVIKMPIKISTIWKKTATVLAFLGLFLSSYITPSMAKAQLTSENFSTKLETTYTINESGNTRVDHAFTITNLQPLYSVTQYALQINSPDITDVTVTGPQNKQIPFQAIASDTITSIAISFPDAVVGQNKQRVFTISFTDPDAALISGQVLEVAVPKIKDPQLYNSYTVNLVTPIRFGSANKVNPPAKSSTITEQGVKTTFTENHFAGVNAIYGTQQTFDITLRYHVNNPNSSVRLTQIALPPDTSYQRMVYSSLDPQPQEIEEDADGNWIATYRVPATTTMTITAIVQAQLSMEPNSDVIAENPTSSHTKSDEFWPTNAKIVKEAAQIHTTPKDIYTFTTEELTYNYSLISANAVRLGADSVLANPLQALCQEFTDVFVTLARANNIPARRLTGYAHTENTVLRPLSLVNDVLHSWPEYYSAEKQRWIQVDPTWGNTSGGINYFDQLDLNHIVFTINGESSQRPYPAGSYKVGQTQTKDIEVNFGTSMPIPKPNYELKLSRPLLGALPFWKAPQIFIQNTSGAAQYNQTFHFSPKEEATQNTLIWPSDSVTYSSFPPFSTKNQQVVVFSQENIFPTQGTIVVRYGETNTEFTVPIYPYFWRWLFNPFVILGLVGGSISFALVTGSVLVLRRRR